MPHGQGRILRDAEFPGMTRVEGAAVFDRMNVAIAAIAALHTVDHAAVGLADYGKPGGFFARYCERSLAAQPSALEWEFYIACKLFRGAAISQGILKRALAGSAASTCASNAGRKARAVADAGWQRIVQSAGATGQTPN